MPGGHFWDDAGQPRRYLSLAVRQKLGDSQRGGIVRSPAYPCATTTCGSTGSGEEALLYTSGGAGELLMLGFVYQMPRIILPRTWVHKGIKKGRKVDR